MPVVNLKHINPIHWIPPTKGIIYKLTIEDNTGEIYDITDQVLSFEVKDNATESIGDFNFTLSNYDEFWTGLFTGNEIFRYYKDYASDATTLRFRGRIEKPSYINSTLKCSGRSESKKFMDITVTKQYVNVETSIILKDLFSTYGSGFTTNNVTSSNIFSTVNWSDKNFWDCVKELCSAASFDCFIDANLDVHYFEIGSVNNTTDAIVHDYNLIEVGEFASDDALVRNRIRVYGATIDGVQVMYTVNDPTSQLKGIKTDTINDDNITSYTQAKEIGDYKLLQGINPPKVGEVSAFLLATLAPGDNVLISSPIDNMPPQYYPSTGWKDEVNTEDGTLKTTVNIYKEPRAINHIMKNIIETQNKTSDTSGNPSDMDNAYTFTFDSDSGTHSDTQIVNGVLKLQTGKLSGTWISSIRTLLTNLDQVYLVLNTNLTTGVIVSASGNGGVDYIALSSNTLTSIGIAKGLSLIVKCVFSSASCEIDSLNLQYKLE